MLKDSFVVFKQPVPYRLRRTAFLPFKQRGINMPQFQIDPDVFPQDFSSQHIPQEWAETKWMHVVNIREPNGNISQVSLGDLIRHYAGEKAKLASYESINEINGRQWFFGMNPESKPGNEFTGGIYHERAGGGSTLIVAAKVNAEDESDSEYVIALLDQERPLMGSGEAKRLQVPGGYPIQMAGKPSDIHLATSVSEGASEVLGKVQIGVDSLVNLYSPYNTNNGMVATGHGQGIATQLLMIPFETLVEREDGTYELSRDLAEVTDRRLERIFGERFHHLDEDLLREVHEPRDGFAACAKTTMAVDRVRMFLIDGI